MKKKEIETEINLLETQNKKFNQLLRQMEKKAIGHLRLLFFLPFFGFVIYQVVLHKRKEKTGFYQEAIKVKTEIAKNEYQILKLKQQFSQVTNYQDGNLESNKGEIDSKKK